MIASVQALEIQASLEANMKTHPDLSDHSKESLSHKPFCLPQGFQAAGIHCGIKRKRKDLGLLISDVPAVWAGVFTTNRVQAAPVLWSRNLLNAGHPVRAIIVNSGNANACTGKIGTTHTFQTAYHTAAMLGCNTSDILVASTGVIGVPLPIETLLKGVETIGSHISANPDATQAFAESIITTDTFVKTCQISVEIQGKKVTISGIAKGSGMIHPNMATMLAFIATDAAISQPLLQQALRESVEDAYHMISVDGDTSTNDMVLAMANGMAGNPKIQAGIENSTSEDYLLFRQALDTVNQTLAQQIARDGEGATKFLTVTVDGAAQKLDAQKIAKSVVSSSLVKTAFYGEDPNWGRILAAMGYAGVDFDPDTVDLKLSSTAGVLPLMHQGNALPFDEEFASMVLALKEIHVQIDLAAGSATATAWGCDLSKGYVEINGQYRT